jgi:adenosylcobinamide-GDP ribazoletransferase
MIDPGLRSAFAVALARALRFYSRLPVPHLAEEVGPKDELDFASTALAVPVAGAVIGALMALALGLAHALGLGAAVSAVAALACGVTVTGALHEDGIADVADGLLADTSVERRLEIMRDPRHGSFGVLALILVMLARFALLAEISAAGTAATAAALIGAAALSRAASLMPLALLPPARQDGAGAAAGRLPVEAFGRAVMVGAALLLLFALIGGFGVPRGLLACVAALAAGYWLSVFAKARIGGQTGDVAGAAQILAELAVYLALAIGLRPL